MTTATQNVTEISESHSTPLQNKFKAAMPTNNNTESQGEEEDSITEHEEEEEFDDEENGNYESSAQMPYPVPQLNYQYSYGYPIIPTISPPQQQQEPIYSINLYNLSRSITTRQLTDFIVPIIGGEYYRSSINHIQFFKQQGDLKSATIKILGYEVAVRLNNALNGHEFEGNILSSTFGPTITSSPPQPPIQYYSMARSPHHRSYSSSTSTGLGSPPALAFPVPLLTPQYEEAIDDGDSPEPSPSPTGGEYSIPPYHHVSPPTNQIPEPHAQAYNPYQFQYIQPSYNRFRYQSSDQIMMSPNARQPPTTPTALPPHHHHMTQQYMASPPHLAAPIIQAVPNSPPRNASYMTAPLPAMPQPPPLPPQQQQQPLHPQFYIPQYQQQQQQQQQSAPMISRGGHNRTRSLPLNPYVHPWLLTHRYQQAFHQGPHQQHQQQQARYRHHNRSRSTNKYAPILDVSDDDDDDDDDIVLNEDNHLEFSESEHVDRCRLFVGNIPFSTHWQELREFISEKISGLTRVEIPQQLNGISKGFAIVFFNDAEKALDCIKLLDGKNFQGRELTVRYDRHLKYIRKYNNIHAMIKNGIKPPTTTTSVSKEVTPISSSPERPVLTSIINQQDEKQEDQLARELMSSLNMK